MRGIHTIIRDRRLLKQSRRLSVLLIAVALVAIDSMPGRVAARSSVPRSVVLQTATVPMLAGTFQPVDAGLGDQFDPHVDCNLVSYTSDDLHGREEIRYFDFSTNTDHVIPGNGADSLSDVSGGRIAFTEANISGPQVVIFDIATQTRTVIPGFDLSHSAFGGNLMAFEDRSLVAGANPSDIGLYDLSTGTVTRLTIDGLFNRNPGVSPAGNAVVWEKCQTDGSACDIYASIQTSPGVFTTSALTGAAGDNRGPDTNGQIVVYISNRSGENDIYFQPVAGGAETRLAIPGDQRDVSIAGNLIAFESQVVMGTTTEYDIFVYDLNTAKLYQVTNTPVNETLTDITVCNGIARIVYAAPALDFNIYAFTFQIPSSAPNQIEDLIALIESFNLPDGTENSLVTKLQDALAAIGVSDTATACDSLSAFINECQAQSGKKITADQAGQLTNAANQIKTDLGCQ